MKCILFRWIYHLALHLYFFSLVPRVLLHPKKYKSRLKGRLGFGFPHIEKNGKKLIWVHAVSLGETRAVASLVRRLKNHSSQPLVLLSSSTETGHQEGLRGLPEVDFHVYLPFDFSYCIGPIVRRVAPDLVILTETDFWYHFQQSAKAMGASLILVNGKLSERSVRRFARFPLAVQQLLEPIDHFYLQSARYQERFTALGISLSKITVTGNLKLDMPPLLAEPQGVRERLREYLGEEKSFVLTLGSTHDPEERLWLEACQKLWRESPQLKLLMVPRHPERFELVARLLEESGLAFVRFSDKAKRTASHPRSIVLVDAMGVLPICYQLSDLAFVGGSLTQKVGGHNIAEPALYGKPVLFGPYMHGQLDLVELIHSYGAGKQVTADVLVPTVAQLISEPAFCQQLARQALLLRQSSRGALEKTLSPLLSLLQKPSSD